MSYFDKKLFKTVPITHFDSQKSVQSKYSLEK